MKSIKLKVTGMSCPGCVTSVRETLLSIKGIDAADIDIESNTATVKTTDDNVSGDELVSAVEKVGFKARVLAA